MRLTDLEPRWIHPNVFIFRCPHCVVRGGRGRYDQYWLSVKSVPMSTKEQIRLFEHNKGISEVGGPFIVVPCKEECCWSVSSEDFATMSVAPSLDASASGHWHGFITNGEIA